MASSSLLKASAELTSRVRRPSLLKKLAKAEDLLPLFPNGAYIGWSGFTGVGYPKYVFLLSPSGIILLPVSCEVPFAARNLADEFLNVGRSLQC